jgi:hypothetical protein
VLDLIDRRSGPLLRPTICGDAVRSANSGRQKRGSGFTLVSRLSGNFVLRFLSFQRLKFIFERRRRALPRDVESGELDNDVWGII